LQKEWEICGLQVAGTSSLRGGTNHEFDRQSDNWEITLIILFLNTSFMYCKFYQLKVEFIIRSKVIFIFIVILFYINILNSRNGLK